MFPELAEALDALIDLALLAAEPDRDGEKIESATRRMVEARAKLVHYSGTFTHGVPDGGPPGS